MNRDFRAVFRSRAILDEVLDLGLLPQTVDPERNLMDNAPRRDRRLAAVAINDERHRDDARQRVALLAPAWAAVGLPARHPDSVIENVLHGLGRKAGSIVGDRH